MKFTSLNELPLNTSSLAENFDIAFVGKPVDERGRQSVAIASASAGVVFSVSYLAESFELVVDNLSHKVHLLDSVLAKYSSAKVLFDATTLDIPELLLLCRYCHSNLQANEIAYIYLEPESYNSSNSPEHPDHHSFLLSESLSACLPIPGFTPELTSRKSGRMLAFLGFEPTRLNQILHADETLIGSYSVAFGIPPFQTSWEMHALMKNVDVIKEVNPEDVHFVGANNPLSTFNLISQYSKSISADERLILAPLGTKPSSIAATLFAAISSNVRIIFDFPVRKINRTTGVGRIHLYMVSNLREP